MLPFRVLGIVLGLSTLGLGSVVAQPWGSGPDGHWGPASRGTPVQALPTPFSHGGSCVQWCVADTAPCDPDYYKVADRRCNVNLNGYFSK